MGPQPISGAAPHRKGRVKRLMRSGGIEVLLSSAPNSDAPITLAIPSTIVVLFIYRASLSPTACTLYSDTVSMAISFR